MPGGLLYTDSRFTSLSTLPTTSGGIIFLYLDFTYLSTLPTTSGGPIFRCTFFTYLSTIPTPFGDSIFRRTFLPTSLLFQHPSGTPSFAARRKIEEKGVPRRRKLHILRFAFRGKSSVVPLLLLSPPNPLRWALAGPLLAAPLNPLELIVTGNRTCCVRTIFPQGDFLRARNGAFDAIKSAAALRLSPCLCVLRCSERQQDLRNHLTSDYKSGWLFLKCQRIRRSRSSTIESGGSSAFGNEIAEKRWCLAFRRSRVKRTPPARRRAGLNRVNCTRAHT